MSPLGGKSRVRYSAATFSAVAHVQLEKKRYIVKSLGGELAATFFLFAIFSAIFFV